MYKYIYIYPTCVLCNTYCTLHTHTSSPPNPPPLFPPLHQFIDSPEVEKELKRLLREEVQAVSVCIHLMNVCTVCREHCIDGKFACGTYNFLVFRGRTMITKLNPGTFFSPLC